MKINLEYKEMEKIRNLIENRIEELRYDVSDEVVSNEEELKQVIREYKELLNKLDTQSKVDH